MARGIKIGWATVFIVAFSTIVIDSENGIAAPRPEHKLVVCASCSITTIREALSRIKRNGEIVVKSGIYREHDLQITTPVKIVTTEHAIVDGESANSHIFHIRSTGVEIAGFIIQNTGSSYLQELAGIRVATTNYCRIVENRFVNTTYGIYLENSSNCEIQDNVFRGAARDETNGGNGIHLWQGDQITIKNNDIQGHRDGIYFEFVKNAQVIGNTVADNLRYGLHFMSSNDCIYTNNTFLRNEAGVAVMYSRRIQMLDNRFQVNRGVASYGLLMKDIHNGVIRGNKFSENTFGVYMEGSNRNEFSENLFLENGWGLRIMGDCEGNTFSKNNMIGNTFDVATNSEQNPNSFSMNYWSQYKGYDLNHDGYGDIPYRPVSLSSVIMENIDSSFVLVKSFFLKMLDEIERSLPELIPERMKDERPLMSPNGDII